ARTNIQDGSVCHVTHASDYCPGGEALVVGDDVTVGHKVVLHACRIGNRCLIGMGAIIMDGAEIADDCMVGAGSVVTPGKKLESGYLYIGSPARKTRPLTESELNYLSYSAQNYVRLKARFVADKANEFHY
ncbi:MAG: gamma carbonic anhydrase family protein, partial [Gammaproteobacteria bacterium]